MEASRDELDSKEHNLAGLEFWEQKTIEKYFNKCKSVFIVGAGCGRETIALQRLGFDADGIECKSSAAKIANNFLKEEGLFPTVTWVPREQLPNTQKKYDGIIIGWGAYGHMPSRTIRIKFLTDLAKLGNPGSILLISFFTKNKYYSIQMRAFYMGSNLVRTLLNRTRSEFGDTILSLDYPYLIHFTDRCEIESELYTAGYKMVFFNQEKGVNYLVAVRQ